LGCIANPSTLVNTTMSGKGIFPLSLKEFGLVLCLFIVLFRFTEKGSTMKDTGRSGIASDYNRGS
jgi:hypothetical protein